MKTADTADKHQTSTRKHSAAHLEQYKWKPGQPSPNPNGRPPDPFSITAAMREGLTEVIPDVLKQTLTKLIFREATPPRAWDQKRLTWREALKIKTLYRLMSTDGDFTLKVVWEMLEGRPTQKLADADGGNLRSNGTANVNLNRLSTEELKVWRELMVKAAVGSNGDEG